MTAFINATTANGIVLTPDNSGELGLQTSGTTALTVNSSQNVGIGVNSLITPGGSRRALQISNGTNGAIVAMGSSTSESVNPRIFSGQFDLGFAAGISTGIMQFYTNDTERMRIDSSGNVLIGTTSTNPTRGAVCAFSGDGSFWTNATSVTTNWSHWSFKNPNGFVGQINTSGSGTTYTTSSDYRLKENIAPMTGALATVSALKPCTYTWKVDGSSGQGFIAHELAEVVPDAVTGEKDAVNEDGSIKPQGIDTSFLVATLTAAIQELNAKVDAQAAEIQALKGAA